jgi:exosortase E/protease (VPEID-CTERM system)
VAAPSASVSARSFPAQVLLKPSTRVASGPSAYAFQVCLAAVFLAELLYLTVTFDTGILDHVDSGWARFLGWSPQYLRLASTITIVTLLFSGKALLLGVQRLETRDVRTSQRSIYLAAHAIALLAFTRITAAILGGAFASFAHPGLWTMGWMLLGGATLTAWGLALFPAHTWRLALTEGQRSIALGTTVGTLAWAVGFLSEQLWTWLARYTFAVVQWVLGLVYPATVSDASKLIVGTPTFRVFISPQCSGYEGIGLILAFLSVYLWLYRNELRFPGALVLLPIGAATIWIVNALRIVALIAIGTSGWPAIARGGFHSQAGWLAFNGIALSFVALTMRGRFFQRAEFPRAASIASHESDPTAAYLGPFVAITATAMVTGAISAGFDWLYTARIFAAGIVLWLCRKNYQDLKITWSAPALAVGIVTSIVWLALIPAEVHRNNAWPAALSSIPVQWAAAWLFFRVVGYVLITPLVEELAFRGFVMRRIMRADFQTVPVGMFTWGSFLISSALFGAFHGGMWLAGTLAGMSFALALYSRRSLGDAVQAHAITNGLIAVYAFATGQWSVWS